MKSKITHISILGSCVSRDAFSIPQGTKEYGENENKYVVDRFIQSINPLSAISPLLGDEISTSLLDESVTSSACNFYKRCYKLDVTKSWTDYLSEVKSDYLVIDFSTVRLDCRKIGNGYLTYEDLGTTVATGIPADMPKDVTKQFLTGERVGLSDLTKDELKNIYYEYLDRITKIYPQKRIIVIDARHTQTFIDSEGEFISSTYHSFDKRYIRDNELIDFAYICAKERIPQAHFIDSLPVSVGNIKHKWGKGGLHFVDEVYIYLYRAIDKIIHSKMTKNAEKLFLLELREKYSKEIFQNYYTTVTKCIQSERNILNYSFGMKSGKYEKNGVTLVVNPDFSFSINGTAIEDTVFYLYQANKNPLDGWRSVNAPIQQGAYTFSTMVSSINESFFIQLILTDNDSNKKWVSGNLSSTFSIDKPYHYQIVRAVIRKDSCVDVNGKLYLEKI